MLQHLLRSPHAQSRQVNKCPWLPWHQHVRETGDSSDGCAVQNSKSRDDADLEGAYSSQTQREPGPDVACARWGSRPMRCQRLHWTLIGTMRRLTSRSTIHRPAPPRQTRPWACDRKMLSMPCSSALELPWVQMSIEHSGAKVIFASYLLYMQNKASLSHIKNNPLGRAACVPSPFQIRTTRP